MQAFLVEQKNRPGELARTTEKIAAYGVNIEAFCLGYGNSGACTFLSDDEPGLRNALESDGIHYKEFPVLTVWLEDRPGTIAKTTRRLADAGVNIEFLAPVDYQAADRRATVAIGADKIDVARQTLTDQLIDWKVPEPILAGAIPR
jgi:hypothetical protein